MAEPITLNKSGYSSKKTEPKMKAKTISFILIKVAGPAGVDCNLYMYMQIDTFSLHYL
jgi:hypothetical protein